MKRMLTFACQVVTLILGISGCSGEGADSGGDGTAPSTRNAAISSDDGTSGSTNEVTDSAAREATASPELARASTVRASPKTTESTGIVAWNLSLPAVQGEPVVAVGLDSYGSAKLQMAVTTNSVGEAVDTIIDVVSAHGEWKIVNGVLQGNTAELDEWTRTAIGLVAEDLKDHQDSLKGTNQVGACFWCASAGLGCIAATATCVASGCGGIVGCGACVVGIAGACGTGLYCCYECVTGKKQTKC